MSQKNKPLTEIGKGSLRSHARQRKKATSRDFVKQVTAATTMSAALPHVAACYHSQGSVVNCEHEPGPGRRAVQTCDTTVDSPADVLVR